MLGVTMTPGGPISQRERDQAVRFLGLHRDADGLDAADHAQRVRLAGEARTHDELYGLFADLPKLTDVPPEAMTSTAAMSTQGGFGAGFSVLVAACTLTGLWMLVNIVAFIWWFCVAFFTASVEFFPRQVFEISTIILLASCGLLVSGYAVSRRTA